MAPRDILLAVAVALVWGLSFLAIRWGVDEVSPLLLTALRYLFAALPAVFFIRRPKVGWPILLGYGLAIGVGQFGILFIAVKLGMPIGLASLVIQLQVFFTILLAFAMFGEHPNVWQIAAAAIAFAGIGVIALERLEGAALLPLTLTIVAAVCWGLGNMAGKKAGRVDMLGFVVWSALVPPLPLLAASLIFEGPGAIPAALEAITWRGVASIAFMSYAATIFGFGAWAWLLSRYPASQVSPFALFVPVAGIAAGAIFLGEQVTGHEIAGGALVFVGLLLNVFGPRLLARRAGA
ncbi:MAG: EamA family transporter [Devosia sp.]|uniref:EamA family transporter n=1 Tax=Devosia sp. 66-22 TaxID=1895753 RepID=UPI000926A319|nr:EamA family transporter [Devosia sp. 66-22]MBN9345205.1 EamA family transporter [Devosia sp.]OJX46439.1 MAG: O-acetylserine/cysteine exporter [Devosia sp. 66-22]